MIIFIGMLLIGNLYNEFVINEYIRDSIGFFGVSNFLILSKLCGVDVFFIEFNFYFGF